MSGIFTWIADATYISKIRYNTLITNTTYGKERRRNKWDSPRRYFVLEFKDRTKTESQEITDFFEDKLSLENFNWVCPIDNVTYNVRFLESSLKRIYKGYDRFDIKLQLTELF